MICQNDNDKRGVFSALTILPEFAGYVGKISDFLLTRGEKGDIMTVHCVNKHRNNRNRFFGVDINVKENDLGSFGCGRL